MMIMRTDEYEELKKVFEEQINAITSRYSNDGCLPKDERLYEVAKELTYLMRMYSDKINYDNCLFSIDTNTNTINVDFVNSKDEILTLSKLNDNHKLGEVVSKVQTRLVEYIQENYDKYDIQDNREYMYTIIEEKAYDIGLDIVANQYTTRANEIESIIDIVCKEIDYDEFDDLFDDILHYSSNIEDKLADLGMSQKDFI